MTTKKSKVKPKLVKNSEEEDKLSPELKKANEKLHACIKNIMDGDIGTVLIGTLYDKGDSGTHTAFVCAMNGKGQDVASRLYTMFCELLSNETTHDMAEMAMKRALSKHGKGGADILKAIIAQLKE